MNFIEERREKKNRFIEMYGDHERLPLANSASYKNFQAANYYVVRNNRKPGSLALHFE